MSKPREWWIAKSATDIYVFDKAPESPNKIEFTWIHVIEKSAYDALEDKIYHLSREKDEEISLLKAELETWKAKFHRECDLMEQAKADLAMFAKGDTEMYPMSLYENLRAQLKEAKVERKQAMAASSEWSCRADQLKLEVERLSVACEEYIEREIGWSDLECKEKTRELRLIAESYRAKLAEVLIYAEQLETQGNATISFYLKKMTSDLEARAALSEDTQSSNKKKIKVQAF